MAAEESCQTNMDDCIGVDYVWYGCNGDIDGADL